MEETKVGIENIEKAIVAIKDVASGSIEKLKLVDWSKVGAEAADLDSDELKKLALEILVIVWNILKDFIDPKTLLLLLLKLKK